MTVNSTQEIIVKTITVNQLHLKNPITKHLPNYADLDHWNSSII